MTFPSNTMQTLFLILVFTVPLAVNPWGVSAFELPKALLLRAFVILIAWLATLLHLQRPSQGPRAKLPNGMLWSSLAFGLITLAASLLSHAWRTSLWGSLNRQQGFLTILSYLMLFWLLAYNLRTEKQVDRLWMTLVWGSLPIVAYGLLQGMGIRPLDWQTDGISPVLATLGRANFFGSYLILIIPLTAARMGTVARPLPLVLLLMTQFICCFLTLARSAWLGLAAAVLIGSLAWAYATRRQRAILVVIAGVGCLGLLIGLVLSGAVITGFPERLTSIFQVNSGSIAARMTIWQTTVSLIADCPWLGYGPETMWPAFMRVFPPELAYYHGRNVIVDRAHNLWLDLGMSVGLSGVLVFGVLLTTTFLCIGRGLATAEQRWNRNLWIALAAALGGHIVDLQANFDLTTTGMIFWLLLALVAVLTKGLCVSSSDSTIHPRIELQWRYAPATLIIFALIGQLCLRPILADVAYWNSQQRFSTLEARTEQAERAVRLWQLEPVYHTGLAELYTQNGGCAEAEAQLRMVKQRRAEDPRVWAAQGLLYAQCGRLSQAEAAWQEAVGLAPNLGVYHYYLGGLLAEQGKLEQATDALRRAIALDATDVAAYRLLAEVYQACGKEDAAQEANRQAEYWQMKTTH